MPTFTRGPNPLPQPVIIRLSQDGPNNIVYRNGDFECALAQEFVFNPSDAFVLQQAFVDSNQLTAATIVIPEDLSVSQSYFMYEVNASGASKELVGGGNVNVDYSLYQMQFDDTVSGDNPIYKIFTASTDLPAGSYEPARLASYLTDQFSLARPLVDSPIVTTQSPLLVGTQEILDFGGVVALTRLNPSYKNQQFWTDFDVAHDGHYPIYEGVLTGDPNTGTGHTLISPISTTGAGSGLVVFLQIPARADDLPFTRYRVFTPGTGYAVNDIVTFASDQFWYSTYSGNTKSYPRWTARCPPGGTVDLVVNRVSSGDSYYMFTPMGQPPLTANGKYKYTSNEFIGASEWALTFDSTRDTFVQEWNHTPVFAGDPPQPVVQIIRDSHNLYQTFDRQCGIAWTDLQPHSFWSDVLGFDLNSCLCRAVDPLTGSLHPISTDTSSAFSIDLPSFERSTTRSFNGLNNFLNAGSNATRVVPGTSAPNPVINVQTTNTVGIVAPNYKVQAASGHFVIEVEGLGVAMLTAQQIAEANIILSRQFSYNDMVVGTADVGVASINTGAQGKLFRKLRVTIRDGRTLEVPNTLGPGSYFYFLHIPGGAGMQQQQQEAMQSKNATKPRKKKAHQTHTSVV